MSSNPIIAAANACALLGLMLFFCAVLLGLNIPWLVALTFPFILWVMGAFFAAVLLIFLRPVFNRISRSLSLVVFLVVGFALPFIIGYFLNFIIVDETPSSLASDYFRTMILILAYSVIGCCASFASWKSLSVSAKKSS